MAKISTYIIDATPTLSDKVIGTDVNDLNMTKNYTLGDIAGLINSSLQLTSTRFFYGDANNNLAETDTIQYIAGGSGSIPVDSVIIKGPTTLNISHIDDINSLAVGKNALSLTNPTSVTAIGIEAASGGAIGITESIAIGTNSLANKGTCSGTIAIGNNAAESINSSIKNVILGNSALSLNNANSSSTIAIGYRCLDSTYQSTSTIENTYIGTSIALNGFFGGDTKNVGIGAFALSQNAVVGQFNGNVAMGYEAMTGMDMIESVNRNIAIGHLSMPNIGGGGPAVPVEDNIGIGQNAGYGQSGQHNIAIGAGSGGTNLLGFFNVAIGTNATNNQTGGDFNVAIGNDALEQLQSGTTNTAIGKAAGSTVVTFTNTTNLGHNSQAQGDNEVVLGDNNVTTLRCNTNVISSLSDLRDKNNVEDLRLGVDFLMDLKPVSWDWNRRDGSMEGKKDSGFIAQNTDLVVQMYNAEDILPSLVDKTNTDQWALGNAALIPVLVKAIQELKAEINELKNG